MIKKESLERITEAFFGKPKRKKRLNEILLFLIIFILSVLVLIEFSPLPIKIKPKARILTFTLGKDLIKINYNFKDTPLKAEIYSIDLEGKNLTGFNKLEFSCRKAKSKGEVSLKVEIENSLREEGYYYIPGIKNHWQIFGIALEEFKEINDWSNIKKISFIIEEWNVREKEDTVYIDEISFKKGG